MQSCSSTVGAAANDSMRPRERGSMRSMKSFPIENACWACPRLGRRPEHRSTGGLSKVSGAPSGPEKPVFPTPVQRFSTDSRGPPAAWTRRTVWPRMPSEDTIRGYAEGCGRRSSRGGSAGPDPRSVRSNSLNAAAAPLWSCPVVAARFPAAILKLCSTDICSTDICSTDNGHPTAHRRTGTGRPRGPG